MTQWHRHKTAGLRKSYQPGGNSPWEVGLFGVFCFFLAETNLPLGELLKAHAPILGVFMWFFFLRFRGDYSMCFFRVSVVFIIFR